MEEVCSRCGEELGPRVAEECSEPVVSHGLCEKCSHHLPAQEGMPLLASLTGFEPTQAENSKAGELGEKNRSVTGSNLTDDHHI